MTRPGEDTRQRHWLLAPAGPKGSGRLRYAAAMHFHRKGHLSDVALETYRVLSARDGEDPAPLLAAHGLAPCGTQTLAAAKTAVRDLLAAIDSHLADVPGPGAPEARATIAAKGGGPVTLGGVSNLIVEAHLDPALAALTSSHPALAAAIAGAAPHLRWITYDGYDPADIGTGFARGHAYASILGVEKTCIAGGDFDLGLFVIAPHVLYRDHAHAAPELYLPLTGPHGWRFEPGAPLVTMPANTPVWNPPNQPHLTKVGPVPFLCLYVWTQDALAPARVLPADDWAELEALRLG